MQTEELVAGRELDALVAEKIMGWHKDEIGKWWIDRDSREVDRVHALFTNNYQSVFDPSTNISAAWQVLDTMVWRIGTANIRLDMEDYGRGFLNDEGAERAVWVTIGDHTAFGPAPLAICRAALAAVKG